MKKILKILIILGLLLSNFYVTQVNAGVPWLKDVQWNENITSVSIDSKKSVGDILLSILKILKTVLWWVLLIFIVYTWAQMMMSMWSDEEELKTAKRQIRYSIIWIIFINIPWSLYEAFYSENKNTINSNISDFGVTPVSNLFLNTASFNTTFNDNIILFVKVLISWVAVFMLTVAWIKILLARWRDEELSKWKHKIIWSMIWLIFVWFIEGWQKVVYKWSISDLGNMFETLANLALFFAWPVAIIYLILAWYYYISSNWDEEKIKKAKNIVINIVFATVIILASYTFLLDLGEY